MRRKGGQQETEEHYYRLQVLGLRLRNLRRGQGKTQKQVAKDMGITARDMSRLENGEYPDCDLLFLFELCSYYRANLADIVQFSMTQK